MAKKKHHVIIGTFGRPHGIKGLLRVIPATKYSESMMDYFPWLIETTNGLQKLQIDEAKPHGKIILAHIANIDTPESAKIYTGKNILIKYEQLPKLPKGEFYWTDLENLVVINQQNITLGKVDHLIETGANDVLIVIGKKRYLIPFLRNQVILDIDLEKEVIMVDWEIEN